MARLMLGTLAVLLATILLALGSGGPVHPGRSESTRGSIRAAQAPSAKVGGEAEPHPEFKAAGVCARCHVVQVLEWGISEHVASGTTCRDCHGPSRAHVSNERNEIKPDTLPRGGQIALSCRKCHERGCPKSSRGDSCQTCHHAHALIDPTRPPRADEGPVGKSLERWGQYRRHMEQGEARARVRDWKGAESAFLAALGSNPGDREAKARLAFSRRRLHPNHPGFTAVGDRFDERVGLPREVCVDDLALTMVLVPAGEFDMGSDLLPASRPVHTVAVDAFYLGKHEVTQAQWLAVMGSNPSVHQGKGFDDVESLPVDSVSWNDCQEFVKRVNERIAGGGFRLPTEIEWEYACRARTASPAEPEALEAVAWFRRNALRDPTVAPTGQSPTPWSTRPVGGKKANAWGLHDMLGNVSEWCSGAFTPYPLLPETSRRPEPMDVMRVLRGGGFADSADGLDPALRHSERANRRFRWNGLRLARDLPRVP